MQPYGFYLLWSSIHCIQCSIKTYTRCSPEVCFPIHPHASSVSREVRLSVWRYQHYRYAMTTYPLLQDVCLSACACTEAIII